VPMNNELRQRLHAVEETRPDEDEIFVHLICDRYLWIDPGMDEERIRRIQKDRKLAHKRHVTGRQG